ncbi:MAG: tryptophan synthase subunit alpha [Christensenella sp.]
MDNFHLIYYISMGCPSIEVSMDMAELYLENGVKALQFDLPSRNPYRETPFVRERMAFAYNKYHGYDSILEALCCFRQQNPDFEMQMVSYEDVMLTIGTMRYIEFCKQNRIKTCRISGEGIIERARIDMNAAGIDTLTFIDYNMAQEDVDFAKSTGRAIMLRNKRDGMASREGLSTWTARIDFLRAQGISAPIYATAGITCGRDLLEAKRAGVQGAFVGSCLMQLWNNKCEMLELLHELENAANS